MLLKSKSRVNIFGGPLTLKSMYFNKQNEHEIATN